MLTLWMLQDFNLVTEWVREAERKQIKKIYSFEKESRPSESSKVLHIKAIKINVSLSVCKIQPQTNNKIWPIIPKPRSRSSV